MTLGTSTTLLCCEAEWRNALVLLYTVSADECSSDTRQIRVVNHMQPEHGEKSTRTISFSHIISSPDLTDTVIRQVGLWYSSSILLRYEDSLCTPLGRSHGPTLLEIDTTRRGASGGSGSPSSAPKAEAHVLSLDISWL
ncbi:uncharacterized protein BDCG_00530 [Blastomyces dermatitidis ER-3]|uniref:Uncharacterized protein n=1 Tax=Ajellomyces dermatitidis (strain ER-3 / ATCC MYA-2586) TaxID=559297 RepID=A0ABP2EM47_AJEDR|nr:uncharacterized protein BDCG_00530 [Blastomyces dermatitidis ER-3]EEQ83725.1 hypothetical protein BDCG_00530 [Blastomyces dermatitidis ER-3]